MERIFTSAALYYPAQHAGGVPLEWFTGLSAFLNNKGVPFGICVADADGFDLETHYELGTYASKLTQAIQKGTVEHLFLYSVPEKYVVVEQDCLAEAGIAYRGGVCFICVDIAFIDSPGLLLEKAMSLARGLPSIRYGIGYRRPLSKGPGSYAIGIGTNADPLDPEGKRIGEWGREERGQARHLTGMFRGAYPASILSDEHVEAVVHTSWCGKKTKLPDCGLGSVRRLGGDCWLWELSELEIGKAEEMLESAGLIVHN
jgi:hypothetical protein